MKTNPMTVRVFRIRYYIEGARNVTFTTSYTKGTDAADAEEKLRAVVRKGGAEISSIKSTEPWT